MILLLVECAKQSAHGHNPMQKYETFQWTVKNIVQGTGYI